MVLLRKLGICNSQYVAFGVHARSAQLCAINNQFGRLTKTNRTYHTVHCDQFSLWVLLGIKCVESSCVKIGQIPVLLRSYSLMIQLGKQRCEKILEDFVMNSWTSFTDAIATDARIFSNMAATY